MKRVRVRGYGDLLNRPSIKNKYGNRQQKEKHFSIFSTATIVTKEKF